MRSDNKWGFGDRIILHIPHSSTVISKRHLPLFHMNQEELQAELLRVTDLYTDLLFCPPAIPDENRIIFPFSRLICDVERFRDDSLEPMAAKGMGVCYTSTTSLTLLKSVTEDHRQEMLKLYDRHHADLTNTSSKILRKHGWALIIDCHSFPSVRLAYEGAESRQSSFRPDICIGTDSGFHTPYWLTDYMISAYESRGYSVRLNEPFEGTIVPMKYYHRDKRLLSIMIEVNRRLYMDEKTGVRLECFPAVRSDIEAVMMKLIEQAEIWR